VSIAPVSDQRDALHYAPPPPLRRRRVFRRVALLLALLIAVGAGIRWFPLLREHVLLQILQRRCMNYQPAPGQVVFDKGAATAALLKDPKYTALRWSEPAAYSVPKDWSDFYALLSPPGLKSWGTVFLGTMRTPQGETRLVAVDMTVDNTLATGSMDAFLLTARVIEPGWPLRRPRLITSTSWRFILPTSHYPVTPAVVDPADPSHLILFNGAIDASLQEGDTVTMRDLNRFTPGGFGSTPAAGPTPPAPSSPASLPTSGRPAARRSASPALR
jgi:hypothetical protein